MLINFLLRLPKQTKSKKELVNSHQHRKMTNNSDILKIILDVLDAKRWDITTLLASINLAVNTAWQQIIIANDALNEQSAINATNLVTSSVNAKPELVHFVKTASESTVEYVVFSPKGLNQSNKCLTQIIYIPAKTFAACVAYNMGI